MCDSLKGCCSKSTLCRVSLKDISLEMTKFRLQVIKTEKEKEGKKTVQPESYGALFRRLLYVYSGNNELPACT